MILKDKVNLLIISPKMKNRKPINSDKNKTLKKLSLRLYFAEKPMTTNDNKIIKKGFKISER